MTGVPISPRRVFGVALGDSEDAGRRTWVCRGHPGSGGVRVESVDRLAELPGGATDRDDAFRALVVKVLDAPRSAWGFDFAFGLPAGLVQDILGDDPMADDGGGAQAPARERWQALVAKVAGSRNPEALLSGPSTALRSTEKDWNGDSAEPRDRRRDLRAIRGILGPLQAPPSVAVLPHDPLPVLPKGTPPGMRARAPHTYLLEIWPWALRRQLLEDGVVETDDAGPASAEGREALVRALSRASLVRPMARRLRRVFADEDSGRALDALLCAVGAWRGYRETDHAALCADPRIGLEGHVYP